MKKFILAALVMYGTSAYSSESFQVCTFEGPCALKVTDNETGEQVWLVKSDSVDLMSIWDGTYWMVPDDEYDAIAATFPETATMIVPAIEPTSGKQMERKGGGTRTPAPAPAPTPAPQGPLVSGSISVNIGDSGCGECHKGSHWEIHKKVMDRK